MKNLLQRYNLNGCFYAFSSKDKKSVLALHQQKRTVFSMALSKIK